MAERGYTRFVITVPPSMAREIEAVREAEGRNRSEFFREAVRAYFSAQAARPIPKPLGAPESEDSAGDPFEAFDEWKSSADTAYDVLGNG
jgi:Arc/MetJ-type ribon-helix-helix transcriptional regulator